jgi:type I restriction enzyme S subunit
MTVLPFDWEEVRLGDISEVKTGPFGSALHASDYVSQGTPIITVEHLGEFRLEGENAPLVGKKDVNRLSSYVLRHGDLVFSRVGSIGRFGYVEESQNGWLFSGRLLRLRTKQGHPRFLYFQMCSPKFINQILEVAVGQTMPSLNTVIVGNLKISLPPLKEQEAIAEALSDADAAIESLDALIAKKRDVKQAAMQRFARVELMGSHAKMVSLGSIVEIQKGELITAATAQSGPYPVIAGGKEAAYFSSKYNREGLTITVSASGANAGYVALRNGAIWASDCSTISENPAVDLRFISAQMQVRQEKIYKSQFGGAQPHVRPKDLVSLEICLVPVERQREIGQILNVMDDELEALTEQVSKLRMVKEGMMQDLLTGKVRLV